MELERIVVAVDGSEMAASAFGVALMIARAGQLPLCAVHVLEPTVADMLAANPGLALDPLAPPAMPAPVAVEGLDHGQRVVPEQIDDILDDMQLRCENEGVAFSSEIGRGTLVDWLLRHIGPGDLLAIGMKGRFARTGVGSTTRALATQAPGPVLVVHGQAGPMNRVMVAFDATAAAERAFHTGVALGRRTGWPVTVLAVGRGDVSSDESFERAERLAGAETDPASTQISVQPVSGEAGSAAAESSLIEKVAGSDRYALLVMGAYADSPWRDLFFGSTTSRVLTHFGGAVVLVHA